MEKETENQQDISKVPPQLQPHVFKKGQSGNLAGRPKGVTLKEYCRDFLSKQSDEERAEFLEGIPKESIWKMAEGNPDTKSELTGKDGGELKVNKTTILMGDNAIKDYLNDNTGNIKE